MKPLTADNNDGRVLLALRAGAMTTGEFCVRGLSVSGWLIREGLIDRVDGGYRITEAGRSACPLRNPLAAKAALAIYSPEVFTMPKGETRITRDQVLDAIKQAGAVGINRKQLLERFGCSESNMDNHLMNLAKMHAIFRPKPGHCVAAGLVYEGAAEPEAKPSEPTDRATRESVLAYLKGKQALSAQAIAGGLHVTLESTEAVLRGLWSALLVERKKVGLASFFYIPEPAVLSVPQQEAEQAVAGVDIEEIEVTPVPDRRAPIVIEYDEDFEVGIFSNGMMSIQIEDGLHDTTIQLSASAVGKLRRFLGLFQEAAQ